MKTLTQIALAASLVLCGTMAQAQSTGYYAGGEVGRMTIKESGETASDTSWGAFGGYNFGDVAVEGSYRKQTGTNEMELYAVPRISLSNTVNLIGKAGVRRSHANGLSNGTSTAYVLGAGVEMNLTKQVFARALVDHSPKTFGWDSVKAYTYTAGIGYKF